MICVDEQGRVTSTQSLRSHPCMAPFDMHSVYSKAISPIFVPSVSTRITKVIHEL